MPKNRPFIDNHANEGGISRNDRVVLAVRNRQRIKFRYDRNDKHFHLSIPEYDTIRVTRLNAKKLAKWINEVLS